MCFHITSSALCGTIAKYKTQLKQACDFQVSQSSAASWRPDLLRMVTRTNLSDGWYHEGHSDASSAVCEAVFCTTWQAIQEEPLARAWCTKFP